MKPPYFRYFFIGGLFLLILGFISLIASHPSFAVKLTTYSFTFFVIGLCFYITTLLNEK